MKFSRKAIVVSALVMVGLLVATGGWFGYQFATTNRVTAYFANSNGLFPGDNVLFLGVKVGTVNAITPEVDRVRIEFSYDSRYKVPSAAKAVILAPSLVSARAVEMTPGYTGGDILPNNSTIGLERTAVPVEWDDFRGQLDRLATALAPTDSSPNGSLGGFVNSAEANLAGKGESINETITELASAVETFSGSSDDIFSIVQNLDKFVTALASSDLQIVQFNDRLASISSALNNSDAEVAEAVALLLDATNGIKQFVGDNRDQLTVAVENVSTLADMLHDNLPNIEQLLHVAPTAFANFTNIYQPAQGVLTGALAFTNFQNPIQFICGAIQAASQLGAEEATKLCVSQLAPVLGLLQINYPPVGVNPIVGVQARQDEVDYSEEWLRSLSTSNSTPTKPAEESGTDGN